MPDAEIGTSHPADGRLHVFGDIERLDDSPRRHAESVSTFLSRASGEMWNAVRALIDQWLSAVPEEERADVVRRLQSKDDMQFQSAFWELYLHETLRRAGFEVTIHPEVAGTSRRPDYLAARDDVSFYVEAKVLDEDGVDRKAEARVRSVYEQLNKVESPNFSLWPQIEAVGRADLPAKAFRRRLEDWIAQQDPDDPNVDWSDLDAPRFRWENDDWVVEVALIPLKPDARGKSDRRPVGITGGEVRERHEDVNLRAALEDKGSAYGDLDLPLVIAVNTFGLVADEFDVMNALYGTWQIVMSKGSDGLRQACNTRAPDGYWRRQAWSHHHVSGVLIGRSVVPWTVCRADVTYWEHPDATQPVPPLPPWVRRHVVDRDGDTQVVEDGHETAAGEFFELGTEWPPGAPWLGKEA